MRDKRTGTAAAQDPDSPINRALADWDCDAPEGLKPEHVSEGIRAVKITKSKVGSEARKAPARKNPAAKMTPRQQVTRWAKEMGLRASSGSGWVSISDTRSDWGETFDDWAQAMAWARRAYDAKRDEGKPWPWDVQKNPAKPRGVKYINEARADKKDDPSWIGYAVQKTTGGGAYAIFGKKTEAVDYARELANKMGRQMAVVRYRYKVQQ